MLHLFERLSFVAAAELLGVRPTPDHRPPLAHLTPGAPTAHAWSALVAELDDLGADPRPSPPSCGDGVTRHQGRALLDTLPRAPIDRARVVATFGQNLDHLHEQHDGRRARRDRGAFYTPDALAQLVVGRALSLTTVEAPTVLDPACGTGAFLLPAAALLGRPQVLDHVRGIDLDPLAVEVCRLRLWLWLCEPSLPMAALSTVVRWQDALSPDAERTLVDVVVGNPPFRTRLRRSTAGGADARRERFGDVAQGYTDDAALFLVDAVDRTADGGCVALVQPLATLAADHATAARRHVADRSELVELWLDDGTAFDAGVTTCVPFLGVGAARPRTGVATSIGLPPATVAAAASPPAWEVGGPWSPVAATAFGIPAVHLNRTARLGDRCRATADFRDQFYGLVPAMADGRPGTRRVPLITSGLIEPAWCAWGERTTRFAGTTFEEPVVDLDKLDSTMAAWAERRLVPKVLVATQTPIIEVVTDLLGGWLPSVPVITVEPKSPEDLWLVAAAIAAPATSAWAAGNLVGTSLTPRTVTVRARGILALPAPCDMMAWRDGADALRAASDAATLRDVSAWRTALDDFAQSMGAAYGLRAADDDVLAWWAARLPTDPSRSRRGGAGGARRARLVP